MTIVLALVMHTLTSYVEFVVATVHHVIPSGCSPLDVPWVEVASIPSVQGGIDSVFHKVGYSLFVLS